MKKIISLLLCALLFCFTFAPAVQASKITETFEDGSYIVEDFMPEDVFCDAEEEASPITKLLNKIVSFFKRIMELFFGKEDETPPVTTTSATKYVEYYDKNGTLLWTVYLTGYFSYNGVTAECTNSSVSYKIVDGDWTLVSMESSENDNIAKGSFVLKQYKLGVPLKTIERTLTLSCDKDGKLK